MPTLSRSVWAKLALLTLRLGLTRLSFRCADKAGFFDNYSDNLDGWDGY